MEITRSDYEIWLTDLLDGKLEEREKERVFAFLEANPDLREEFDNLYLIYAHSSENGFPYKKSLIKTTSELPESQFELLCAAFTEGDLDEEGKIELAELCSAEADRKKVLTLISAARLKPPSVVFNGKKSLRKQTPFEKALRLGTVIAGLAATVALLIVTSVIAPKYFNQRDLKEMSASGSHPGTEENVILIKVGRVISVKGHTSSIKPTRTEKTNTFLEDRNKDEEDDKVFPEIRIAKTEAPALAERQEIIPSLKPELIRTLSASGISESVPATDIGMNRVERFITRTLRKNILGAEENVEKPIEFFEIAEAGVEGMNKLLGWQMALNENSDENGVRESVSFSSKMLKFSKPVKKSGISR